MSRLSWPVGVLRAKAPSQGGALSRKAVWLASLLATMMLMSSAVVLMSPAVASAATCTDTWTGPEEGNWETAADWSLGERPGPSEVACIGPKTTVHVFQTVSAGVVQDEGTLAIGGGSLEVATSSEASNVASLMLTSAGTLTGAGTVDISESLSVSSGVMSGSGETVIQPGASATLGEGGGSLYLEGECSPTKVE